MGGLNFETAGLTMQLLGVLVKSEIKLQGDG